MTLIRKDSLPKVGGTTFCQPPYNENADLYEAVALGDAAGLTQFSHKDGTPYAASDNGENT